MQQFQTQTLFVVGRLLDIEFKYNVDPSLWATNPVQFKTTSLLRLSTSKNILDWQAYFKAKKYDSHLKHIIKEINCICTFRKRNAHNNTLAEHYAEVSFQYFKTFPISIPATVPIHKPSCGDHVNKPKLTHASLPVLIDLHSLTYQ